MESTNVSRKGACIIHEELQQRAQAYDKFDFTLPTTKQPLAIEEKKEEVLNLLEKENAIVVKGFTGCGKTTQIPQFVLDDCYSKRIPCNIVVTQPRRIAAISVARRVCEERGWQLGTVVGYQVGMERKLSKSTCLTYMTTGCLLQSLVGKKSLDGYTHIIVDEVHERDEDTDLLLMVVRKFMQKARMPVKVILMSATADTKKFSEYFHKPTVDGSIDAPVVEVKVAEPFAVRVYHLDDLVKHEYLQTYITDIDPSEPKIEGKTYKAAAKLISALDQRRENLRFGRYGNTNLSNCRGSVLVFLPGVGEIEAMHQVLLSFEDETKKDDKNFWYILPLHSRITSEEQSRVFHPLPDSKKNYRKIILSTNIAESSLTVPDIVYIIDFCLHKEVKVDPNTNFCTLKLNWAPRSSCVQRKGRVGRVSEGIVYRMVSKHFFDNELPEDPIPEIKRCPLEHAVLRTKLLDLGEPKALLALVIDPPRWSNIVKTISTLKEVGALYITANGKLTVDDGDLTYLGRVLCYLPIDIHLGKLIMLGYVFNMLEESIIMAAGLSSKNIFSSPYKEKLYAYLMKMVWADGTFSDPITILKAYEQWKEKSRSGEFRRPGQSEKKVERDWARSFYLELKALKDMDALVSDIKYRLSRMGIEAPPPQNPVLDSDQKALLLRVVIFGAFYPHYFSRKGERGEKVERDALRALCGLDPYSTVRLGGFPTEHLHKAYAHQLQQRVKEDIFDSVKDVTWNLNVSFEDRRVFLQFKQEGNSAQRKNIPGRIGLPVYLAVKQRLLRMPYQLQLMNPQIAEQYCYQIEENAKLLVKRNSIGSRHSDIPYEPVLPRCRFPLPTEDILKVTVSYIEAPDHFWFQRIDEQTAMEFRHLQRIISQEGPRMQHCDHQNVRKGNLVLAPFFSVETGNAYYRAKVLHISNLVDSSAQPKSRNRNAQVYFIDFGNTGMAPLCSLRLMPPACLEFAPFAMQAVLTGIGPSLIRNAKGHWHPDAKTWFSNQVLEQPGTAKIFSVVDHVTSMDLKDLLGGSCTEQLLKMNYAVRASESLCSKEDNTERQIAKSKKSSPHEANNLYRQCLSMVGTAEQLVMDYIVPQPTRYEHGKSVTLKGPYSPLEMNLIGKVRSLTNFTINVEDDSVNSVILDDRPSDRHDRLLVATVVSINEKASLVTLRNTTLLPNIAGLPALLSLLFAPRVEYRTDEHRTRLTGAICGLGYNKENRRSLYQEHDMEITFDTEISSSDVLIVNQVRFLLNSVLASQSYSTTVYSQEAPSIERLSEVSTKVLQLLSILINAPRKNVDVVHSSNTYNWNVVKKEHLLQSDSYENQSASIFPLHDLIQVMKQI